MILYNWDGFPQYGARCIRALVDALPNEKIVVAAMRPIVPIKGMEEICGCPVVWVEPNDPRSVVEICGEMPRFAVISGWFSPMYNRWRDEVRAAGGRVIGTCDNNWLFTWKTLLCAIKFRLCTARKYDGFFVPGKSGRKLLRLYGVPDEKIFEGVYAADACLFTNGAPLPERDKKIIYVGQFIERKNVRRLVQAFILANVPGWTLEMYGSGPLKAELTQLAAQAPGQSVKINDFVQPEQLAGLYQTAPIFCLPSIWEHWGLVVHEAALSGCVLLLGNRTGAASDLLGQFNGATFNPNSVDAMAQTLKRAMNMTADDMSKAQEESLRLAKTVSIDRFVAVVKQMMSGADGKNNGLSELNGLVEAVGADESDKSAQFVVKDDRPRE